MSQVTPACRIGTGTLRRASIIIMDTPRTRSHSQLKGWADCGEAYRLQRVMKAKSRPGWWFPGGTAVHATIEKYLREVALKRQ